MWNLTADSSEFLAETAQSGVVLAGRSDGEFGPRAGSAADWVAENYRSTDDVTYCSRHCFERAVESGKFATDRQPAVPTT